MLGFFIGKDTKLQLLGNTEKIVVVYMDSFNHLTSGSDFTSALKQFAYSGVTSLRM